MTNRGKAQPWVAKTQEAATGMDERSHTRTLCLSVVPRQKAAWRSSRRASYRSSRMVGGLLRNNVIAFPKAQRLAVRPPA
jgi:hypothetical protein